MTGSESEHSSVLSNGGTPSLASTPGDVATDTELSWLDQLVEAESSASPEPEGNLFCRLPELFSENVLAKICRTATRSFQPQSLPSEVNRGPFKFPETVPQTGPNAGRYEFRDQEFWTCGFFPGTLYALLERNIKYPQTARLQDAGLNLSNTSMRSYLRSHCRTWGDPLRKMASRTDTHDIGFIIMPALRRDWELTGNEESLCSITQAARSLATRYLASAGAIRSWDCLLKKDLAVTDMDTNFLVIIDSLCNLDLLFYASAHSGDDTLAEIAATHARTLLKTHLRPELAVTLAKDGYRGQLFSTCHVANIDPATGDLKWHWTAQGYATESTWSRGQAWAILGYAQTYFWTKDKIFLDAACGLAEYFLYRLDTAPPCVEIPFAGSGEKSNQNGPAADIPRKKGRYVPLWDFDAPVDESEPLRDTSAAMIAANGMLLLSQQLSGVDNSGLSKRYLHAAIQMVRDTINLSLATETAHFVRNTADNSIQVEDAVPGVFFDGILKNGTANNNEQARRRYWNHGLVYGDYYFVEFGNRLLGMGIV